MTRQDGPPGTSLLEAIVAIGLLTGAVMLLASLTSFAIRANARARDRTLATLLAAQKLEALAVTAQDLALSPADALAADAPGFADVVDAAGRDAGPAAGQAFVRRWRVAAFGGDAGLLTLTVEAAPCRRRERSAGCGDPDARVRLTTVRSRIVR